MILHYATVNCTVLSVSKDDFFIIANRCFLQPTARTYDRNLWSSSCHVSSSSIILHDLRTYTYVSNSFMKFFKLCWDFPTKEKYIRTYVYSYITYSYIYHILRESKTWLMWLCVYGSIVPFCTVTLWYDMVWYWYDSTVESRITFVRFYSLFQVTHLMVACNDSFYYGIFCTVTMWIWSNGWYWLSFLLTLK